MPASGSIYSVVIGKVSVALSCVLTAMRENIFWPPRQPRHQKHCRHAPTFAALRCKDTLTWVVAVSAYQCYDFRTPFSIHRDESWAFSWCAKSRHFDFDRIWTRRRRQIHRFGKTSKNSGTSCKMRGEPWTEPRPRSSIMIRTMPSQSKTTMWAPSQVRLFWWRQLFTHQQICKTTNPQINKLHNYIAAHIQADKLHFYANTLCTSTF